MVIYVIGYIGSDRMTAARAASEEYGVPLYDLAAEIEQRDGRTIRRMVITMGEHELRNKEYEALTAILKECGEPCGTVSAVVCCTDDLILDPMSTVLVRAGKVIVADDPAAADCSEEAILDEMFERAIKQAPDDQSLHYAFLLDPDRAAAREKFRKLYEHRRPLYDSFRK